MKKIHIILLTAILYTVTSFAEVIEEPSQVDMIFDQINALSKAEQTALMKRLLKHKADLVVDEVEAKVETLKQQVKKELDNPKLKESLDKAKKKLNRFYDFFEKELKEEDETKAEVNSI